MGHCSKQGLNKKCFLQLFPIISWLMAVVESYDLKVLTTQSKEVMLVNIVAVVAVVAVVAHVTDVAAMVNQCQQKKTNYIEVKSLVIANSA